MITSNIAQKAKKDANIVGPDNNLPASLLSYYAARSELMRFDPESKIALASTLNMKGKIFSSFTRARNRDRIQLAYYWNVLTSQLLGIVHIGSRAQGNNIGIIFLWKE